MSLIPMVFEPQWRVVIGPITEDGKGLLTRTIQRDLIESFSIYLGTHVVRVNPILGQIWFDTEQIAQLPKSKLIWLRRMQKELQAGSDRNTASFRCLYYGFGLEHNGQKHGYRLHEDGRIIAGLA